MQRKLPGIDTPAATEAKILHAAAFLAFKQHVERLARAGSDLQTYTCWMHGVEVCYSPYVLATRTDSDLFPPLPKMPCCVDNCQRCAAHFGGFKFPWLGLWNSRGVVLPPDVHSQRSLGLLLSEPGAHGAFVGGGLRHLHFGVRRGPPRALRASTQMLSG